MDIFFHPTPITILAASALLILGALFGAFWRVFHIVKDAAIYVFLIPLLTGWALNTLSPGILAFSYWNILALGTLNISAIIVISGGVNSGISTALPDPRDFVQPMSPQDIEDRVENLQNGGSDNRGGN